MNIYNLTRDELEEYFVSHGSKKFHADQLFSWLYEKRISSVSEVTDIKKEMLEHLKEDYSFSKLKLVQVERDIDVCKYLFELDDGEHIESNARALSRSFAERGEERADRSRAGSCALRTCPRGLFRESRLLRRDGAAYLLRA